jgi:hypothetical protein
MVEVTKLKRNLLSPPSTLRSHSGCHQVFGPEVRIIMIPRKFEDYIASHCISYHSLFCPLVLEYLRFTRKWLERKMCVTFFSATCVRNLSHSDKYCNGFAESVSRQRLGKHGQRVTMEGVSQWANVIARC